MSESVPKFRLAIGSWLLVGSIIVALVGSYSLAQSQIADHEKRLQRLELRDEQSRIDYAAVRELLVRIDERTVEIKRKQDLAK